jgi:hypothetical protein
MALFSKKPLVCPACQDEVATGPNDRTGIGHFATHLADSAGAGSALKFACGCPDAVFDISADLTNEVMRHLRDRHHLKVIVV